MSTADINKVDSEDSKTLDKQQIEAEEKEIMLKESEATEADVELRNDGGPVKAALCGDITEQGREDEEAIEKDIDNEKAHDKSDDETKSKQRFQFLGTCPFSQYLHQTANENDGDSAGNKKSFGMFNVYPKIFKKQSASNEAALASMETLEDKLDTPNDGMENIKLDIVVCNHLYCSVRLCLCRLMFGVIFWSQDDQEGKVATRLPLKERIRQKRFIADDILVCGVVLLVLLAIITGIVIGTRVGPPNERPLRLGRFITTQTSCGLVEGLKVTEGDARLPGSERSSVMIQRTASGYRLYHSLLEAPRVRQVAPRLTRARPAPGVSP
ncbi:hypothetical protein KGM_211871 [Danaus plexippus plexippus]|uniref:Uncharacterized protein n=1 Tax=Danaus plexippus plexippus TaxID=278856 RepID=A0A212FHZ5_DANPL|nr:hypothetical protein KGM_211871 [Danaus plexippus plexippus]